MKNILFSLIALLMTAFSQTAEAKEYPLYIVTTTSQIGDLVSNIAGDTANVEYLMGTGIDPHLYHPTRADISKLMKADVIFYNGVNLEGKMEHLLEQLSKEKTAISIAGSLALHSLQTIDGEENYDPHVWMNVKNWITSGENVVSALSKFNPDDANKYEANNAAYTEKLKELDTFIQNALSTIPEQQRILITAHDAFGYLGSAYGIKVVGIQGISTESEAGLSKIEGLVDLLVTQKIPSVFVETSVGDHNIKAIIEGAQARGHDVQIGGSLYSDAMGSEGTDESTYIGMMKYNVNTITKALGGTLPEKQQEPLPEIESGAGIEQTQ